jgi:uncharacterized protein
MRQAMRALLLFLVAFTAWAQVAVPPYKARVVDTTGTLTREQTASLEQMLRSFEERKGSQIAVLIVPTTAPETIEQYSLRVAEQWKPGRKKVDDGVILVVAKNDRAVRIEVGYGLEGTLTDAVTRLIIENAIVPRFRANDYPGGIARGVDDIISVLSGDAAEWKARAAKRPDRHTLGWDDIFIIALIVAVFILVFVLAAGILGGQPSGRRRGSSGSGWASGSSSGSSWSDSSGGSSGGGFSGGDFSGGGGSFGGGGSSGSW